MGDLLSTLFRTVILDDTAYEEWRERPNLFLRGLVLILVISLVAGLLSFALNLVNEVRPVDVDRIEEEIRQAFDLQLQWNPAWQDPEIRQMMEDMIDVIVPMVADLARIEAPLPHGIVGFLNATTGWLSRAFTAIGGFLFYGALVLIFVNLLGGSAKLADFYGTAALYVIPGLLTLLSPIFCLGALLWFIGAIWSIVVYIKATAVATRMDGGRAVLAVLAPFFSLILLGVVVSVAAFLWVWILV
jgi:hypothetical protein